MTTVRKSPVLEVTDEDIRLVRESLNITDMNAFTESMNDILEWCSKEQHLADAAKYLNHSFLESLFGLARGSIEGTKQKIEKLLTTRGLVRELVLNRKAEEFEKYIGYVNIVPLPKLYPKEQSRVIVTQVAKPFEDFDYLTYYRYLFLIGEYRMNYDCCLGERYIIDMKNVTFSMISKFNPVLEKKAHVLSTEGYATKIKGVHILNAPSFVDKFLFLLKQTMKPKVASRVHVHSTYEELHEHIPKEILPKEYGGDEETCTELAKKWEIELRTKEVHALLEDYDHLVTDESKRLSPLNFTEDYMGMPGSFKMLNVD